MWIANTEGVFEPEILHDDVPMQFSVLGCPECGLYRLAFSATIRYSGMKCFNCGRVVFDDDIERQRKLEFKDRFKNEAKARLLEKLKGMKTR